MKPFSSSDAAGRPTWAGWGTVLRQIAPTGVPLLIVLGLGMIAVLYATCTQYIQPDQFAVKQVDVPVAFLTGKAGIHTNVYGTGMHWRMPGCEKYLVFPKSVRAITLHSKGKANEDLERFVRYEEAAHIQTSDGFFINLDV